MKIKFPPRFLNIIVAFTLLPFGTLLFFSCKKMEKEEIIRQVQNDNAVNSNNNLQQREDCTPVATFLKEQLPDSVYNDLQITSSIRIPIIKLGLNAYKIPFKSRDTTLNFLMVVTDSLGKIWYKRAELIPENDWKKDLSFTGKLELSDGTGKTSVGIVGGIKDPYITLPTVVVTASYPSSSGNGGFTIGMYFDIIDILLGGGGGSGFQNIPVYIPIGEGGGGSSSGGNGGNNTPPICALPENTPFTIIPIEGSIPGEGDAPYFDYTTLDNPIFVEDEPVEMPPGFNFQIENFNTNLNPPIRVIGKTEPRGNTEDMQYGNNGDATGILSNMPNFTNTQLFAEMQDLFHKTSTGELETVSDIMIDRFKNNIGGQFTNASLSQAVFENSKFQNFIVKFGKELHLALAAKNWDINQVTTITMLQGDRPVFNGLYNKFHGLQILINDTEETIIELTNFSINATTHIWTANLNITIKDHFGLDKIDALTYQNNHAGFAAWWILQHCRGYKPFETIISFTMQLQTQ